MIDCRSFGFNISRETRHLNVSVSDTVIELVPDGDISRVLGYSSFFDRPTTCPHGQSPVAVRQCARAV